MRKELSTAEEFISAGIFLLSMSLICYFSGWILILGGIATFVEAIKCDPVNRMIMLQGIVKIALSVPVGLFIFSIGYVIADIIIDFDAKE